MPGPLDGVSVVDFTEYVAGPYGTMMLADMGADVLKVEPINGGDHWRRHQPLVPHESRYFLGVNRGKRSIALRHDCPEGREVVERLVAAADVVVLNYRPSVARDFGLDYETLARIRPDLIYCNITAFGEAGPFAGRPGFDLLVQALAGIMDFERKVDRGVPIGITSFAPADLSTGMFVAFAVASALYRRLRTGEGQKIDASLFASALAIQYRPTLGVESLDREPRRQALETLNAAREAGTPYEGLLELRTGLGLQRAAALYYRVYQTKDSLIAVACLNNRQRRNLRDALGLEDPSIDGAVFEATPAQALEDHEAKMARFEEVFRQRTTSEWLDLLTEADVPCVPVVLTEEIFDHPQVEANDLMYSLEHPLLGEVRQPRPPIRMNNAEVGRAKVAPLFSADARDVLAALGYSDEEIRALGDRGVVVLREG